MTTMPSASKLIERSAGICRHQGMGKIQAYITVAMAARDAKALLSGYGWTDLGWLDEVEHLAAYRAAAVSGWADPCATEPACESATSDTTIREPLPSLPGQRPAPLQPKHSR